MKRPVHGIAQVSPIVDAARRMREHHVGLLVVTAREGSESRVVGVVTDRDIVVEAVARGFDPAATAVGEIAQGELVAVGAGSDAGEALARMKEAGVRRLLVVGDDGRLAGIVSTDDLVEAMCAELALLVDVLRADIDRETRERTALPAAAAASAPVFLPAGTPGMRWPGS
ncbi:MAG: CBS domain-containing protein [Rubrivivax sp.]|nr:CBS domain-containing protein [Rubrivivax sp.]